MVVEKRQVSEKLAQEKGRVKIAWVPQSVPKKLVELRVKSGEYLRNLLKKRKS